MKTIVICSSASFYELAVGVRDELHKLGYEVIVPKNVDVMLDSDDFDVSHYKDVFKETKSELIRSHFEEIAKGDAILVLNYEKHGMKNYIGGNVLMEMGIAFYLRKLIFILNEVPEDSAFLDEILGLAPAVLHGKLASLKI